MNKFLFRYKRMTGLFVLIIVFMGASVDGEAKADDNTPLTCDPALSEKANISDASKCIKDFINKFGEKKDDEKANSSYALGVRFQSEVASEFRELDYAQFLLGALDQANKKTRFPLSDLNAELAKELLSTAEQSTKFVKGFSGRANVISWKGVYYIDRTEEYTSTDQPLSSNLSAELNQSCEKSTLRQYIVGFRRLKLDNDPPVRDVDYKCVSVDEDEIIRGWRTALEQMQEGDIWELVVPAPLAYGSTGTGSSDEKAAYVEPDEALRFLIKLYKKS